MRTEMEHVELLCHRLSLEPSSQDEPHMTTFPKGRGLGDATHWALPARGANPFLVTIPQRLLSVLGQALVMAVATAHPGGRR